MLVPRSILSTNLPNRKTEQIKSASLRSTYGLSVKPAKSTASLTVNVSISYCNDCFCLPLPKMINRQSTCSFTLANAFIKHEKFFCGDNRPTATSTGLSLSLSQLCVASLWASRNSLSVRIGLAIATKWCFEIPVIRWIESAASWDSAVILSNFLYAHRIITWRVMRPSAFLLRGRISILLWICPIIRPLKPLNTLASAAICAARSLITKNIFGGWSFRCLTISGGASQPLLALSFVWLM